MSIGENAYLRHLHDHYIKSLERMTKALFWWEKKFPFFFAWKLFEKIGKNLHVSLKYDVVLKSI